MPAPRPFTALLRSNLPSRPADWLAYAAFAAALLLVLHMSVVRAVVATVITIVLGVIIASAAEYAMARRRADGTDGDGR